MDKKLVWGLGISVVSVFIRYAVPTMSPWLAWSGVAVGALIILWAVVGWVIDQRKRPEPPRPAEPARPSEGANVTSHNQSGGITSHTVNIGGDNVRR